MKKITDEQFENALIKVIDKDNKSASQLLSIPGIYEILSEYYNNDVIDYLQYDYETNNL